MQTVMVRSSPQDTLATITGTHCVCGSSALPSMVGLFDVQHVTCLLSLLNVQHVTCSLFTCQHNRFLLPVPGVMHQLSCLSVLPRHLIFMLVKLLFAAQLFRLSTNIFLCLPLPLLPCLSSDVCLNHLY